MVTVRTVHWYGYKIRVHDIWLLTPPHVLALYSSCSGCVLHLVLAVYSILFWLFELHHTLWLCILLYILNLVLNGLSLLIPAVWSPHLAASCLNTPCSDHLYFFFWSYLYSLVLAASVLLVPISCVCIPCLVLVVYSLSCSGCTNRPHLVLAISIILILS